MGYDERQQPNSSGTLVAVLGVGLVLAILAIIVVAGVGLFWVRTSTRQAQAIAMEQRVIAELHRVGTEAQRESAMAQLEQPRVAANSDPRISFMVELDREGNSSIEEETIGLDELKSRLANAFSLRAVRNPASDWGSLSREENRGENSPTLSHLVDLEHCHHQLLQSTEVLRVVQLGKL